jgi:branched-chain amino acid transport system substrate-binding protein
MASAVEFILQQHDWKAGGKSIGFQSCDDATAQAGSWDSAKCTANARNYANNSSVLGVIGHVQLGLRQARDPDREPRVRRTAADGEPRRTRIPV